MRALKTPATGPATPGPSSFPPDVPSPPEKKEKEISSFKVEMPLFEACFHQLKFLNLAVCFTR